MSKLNQVFYSGNRHFRTTYQAKLVVCAARHLCTRFPAGYFQELFRLIHMKGEFTMRQPKIAAGGVLLLALAACGGGE
jgi:hypothetical protein